MPACDVSATSARMLMSSASSRRWASCSSTWLSSARNAFSRPLPWRSLRSIPFRRTTTSVRSATRHHLHVLDEWGIADGYWDIDGDWHPTPAATRVALRAAMGDPQPFGPQWFVSSGTRHRLLGPCRLELEDGTDRGVVELLGADVPAGYHWLHPTDGGPSTWLVVHPTSSPPAPAGWGVAAQVYSLWRRDGWGIGDLQDVGELGAAVAA